MIKNDKPAASARAGAELDEGERIRRWRRGMQAAEERQRAIRAAEGPRPEQAVAECLSALNALEAMGIWPGSRDPVSEEGVDHVRERWARIQRRARAQALEQGQIRTLEVAVATAIAQLQAEVRRLVRTYLREQGHSSAAVSMAAVSARSPMARSNARRRPVC